MKLKELNVLALAMIFHELPPSIQQKVQFEILKQCDLPISMEDLKPKPSPTVMAVPSIPMRIPSIYCKYCNESIHKLGEKERRTPELIAEALDKHLKGCLVFKVILKHMRLDI